MGSAKSIRTRVGFAAGLILTFAAVQAADTGGRRFLFDQDNVPGWMLMSSAERAAHHQKLMSLKTTRECGTYMDEHRRNMETRATERGKTLRAPRFDLCDQMKAKGLLE